MAFSKVIGLYNHHCNSTLECFCYRPTVPSCQFSDNPYSYANSKHIQVCSIDLPFLEILYKWNHTIDITAKNVQVMMLSKKKKKDYKTLYRTISFKK